ncbi:MAG: (2Fe-2S)-binding protein [Porticoccaceae bacterium]
MYICLCKGVTEKQVRREVLSGVSDYDELQNRLEIGLCCGQCKESTLELVEETLSGHHADNVINMWQPGKKASENNTYLQANGY